MHHTLQCILSLSSWHLDTSTSFPVYAIWICFWKYSSIHLVRKVNTRSCSSRMKSLPLTTKNIQLSTSATKRSMFRMRYWYQTISCGRCVLWVVDGYFIVVSEMLCVSLVLFKVQSFVFVAACKLLWSVLLRREVSDIQSYLYPIKRWHSHVPGGYDHLGSVIIEQLKRKEAMQRFPLCKNGAGSVNFYWKFGTSQQRNFRWELHGERSLMILFLFIVLVRLIWLESFSHSTKTARYIRERKAC